MDFGTLLHVAQKKATTNKSDVKYYSTKFEPPKKEERNKTQLSANIQKFLARKEAEEKQKAEEEKIKKLELLALRSQDRKAKKRIQCMLQRTKSANKSVIEDAVDNKDTALTLAGPSQPDEDDYGYESQESAAIYAKMMERYNAMPEEEKFPGFKKKPVSTNLLSTKERVKAALLREEEEANMPHKRKRRSKTDDNKSELEKSNNNEDVKTKEEKPKFKKPPPPIMNFSDLLKIAEKKQFEPILIEPKKVEEEQLLTKKQKKELEKEKAWRESREARLRAALTAPRTPKPKPDEALPPPSKIPKVSSNDKRPSVDQSTPMKIPKLNTPNKPSAFRPDKRPDSQKTDRKSETPKRNDSINGAHSKSAVLKERDPKRPATSERPKSLTNPQEKPRNYLPGDIRAKQRDTVESKPRQYLPGDIRAKQQDVKPKQYLPGDIRAKQQSSQEDKLKQTPASSSKPADLKAKVPTKQFPPKDLKPKQFPPADVRPKQFPPADVRPKQFPPADVRSKSSDLRPKQFPPSDMRGSKQFPPRDVHRKPPRRPIIQDEDSEYDSEMDDFIDDGPLGGEEDYSRHIKEIFGYDKSRYRNLNDDDDAAMESKFSTIMKEEYLSTKIGIMEDLEDIRKEAEEKKRKALMKKKMKR